MKKKAFTLTELLVVVVIIGVLSAVVLPKFTKMLETRKATEAEDIMTAVRNEQEARCTLGKDYTDQENKLASFPKTGSKHFSYTFDKQGITATGEEYVLKIPSYTDGRICCASGCNKLNKDYPECGNLNPDPATCTVPSEEEPGPGPTNDPCKGRENEHAGDSAWEWTGVEPECWRQVTQPNPCEGRENEHAGDSTWEWTGVAPACWKKVVSPSTCEGRENEHAGDSTWEWTGVEPDCWKQVTSPCDKKDYDEKCPDDPEHYIHYRVNDACEYEEDASECKSCDKKDYDEQCPDDPKHYIHYKVNDACEYEEDKSECEESCIDSRTRIASYKNNMAVDEIDTCDGDNQNKYTCPPLLKEKKECIDVYGGKSSPCSGDAYGPHECHTGADCYLRTGRNYAWQCLCINDRYTCVVEVQGCTRTSPTGPCLSTPAAEVPTAWHVSERVVCCPGGINPVQRCDDSHREGEVSYFSCECGQGAKTWHCGSDTNYVWQATITKDCVAKPPTEEPCPQHTVGGPVTVTYKCNSKGKWVVSWKNVEEVCKSEAPCVQLVEHVTCNYEGTQGIVNPGNNTEYTHYRQLPSCSDYNLKAGSFVAVGAITEPFCQVKGTPNDADCVHYLTPGPTKKCKAWQITNI